MAANTLLAFFARHKVAGNLLMVLMILFGLMGLGQLNRQLMPDFTLEQIQIDITWAGASPQDLESNVIEPLERELLLLDNLDRVEATAFEGRAVLMADFDFGSNMAKALTDTQSAVARVATFPQEIERPLVRLLQPTEVICNIEISGPFSESALKSYAWEIRNALLQRGVSLIRMSGLRKSELRVEVPAETLRRLDLTLDDIAQRIARSSLDLPGGTLETDRISRQIRSERRARTAAELGELEVLSSESGERLRLKDIARIHETSAEGEVARLVDEYSSININVRRSRGLDSMLAQQAVEAYLEEFRAGAPASPPGGAVRRFRRPGEPAGEHAAHQRLRRPGAGPGRSVPVPGRPPGILGRAGHSHLLPRGNGGNGRAGPDSQHDQHVRADHGDRHYRGRRHRGVRTCRHAVRLGRAGR